MKITVKLFATFRIGREKVQQLELSSETTPGDIIKSLGIEPEEVAILLINGMDGQLGSSLKDGDLLAIFPPVGGG